MNFVLSKAGGLLMQAGAEPRASMSAARAIVEVCAVAQSHDMPMPSNVLDGLLQLIQQTTDPDVRRSDLPGQDKASSHLVSAQSDRSLFCTSKGCLPLCS